MHRYFLIPFIGFFIIVSIFVFFLQFINEDWKFIAPKIILPESCDNNIETKFIIHESDKKINRSFKDEQDIYDGNQFHPIFLLPCERDDRGYDIRTFFAPEMSRVIPVAKNRWFLSHPKSIIDNCIHELKNNQYKLKKPKGEVFEEAYHRTG